MAVREIEFRGKPDDEIDIANEQSDEQLLPSNWKSEWQQLIEERSKSASTASGDKDLKSLLRDLFG